MNVPGLKIMVPASPSDAKGLLRTAVDMDDPVLTFEACTLWGLKEDVFEEEYRIPFGVARTLCQGSDVTVVAISSAVPKAVKAAEALADDGISVEVIDPARWAGWSSRTILNVPQVAILAVGATRQRQVWNDGDPTWRPVAELTLTCDHRAVDGATGAGFLAAVRELLQG